MLNFNTKLQQFNNNLFWASVCPNSLGLFRICFGLVMIWEFSRMLFDNVGFVRYINPVFQFKYPLFEWVVKAPDAAMYVVFSLGLIAAVGFCLGAFYKYSSRLLLIVYSYLFLLDVSYWNNHYFLFVLLLLVFPFVNANYYLSVDKHLLKIEHKQIQVWQINIFRFLFALTLIFGAFSKIINPDWFSNTSAGLIFKNSFLRLGLDQHLSMLDYLVPLFTYGGFLFDLLIVPILLYKRTFWFGVVLMLIFNLTNHFLLNIGSFPFLMISALVFFYSKLNEVDYSKTLIKNKIKQSVIYCFVTVLILLPFRHFTIEGNVLWTSEGKVGAWHMMSGSTTIQAKYFLLKEKDDSGSLVNEELIDVTKFLNSKQLRTLGKWPTLVPQFAKFLKKEAELSGFKNVSIYADVRVSRNGRGFKPIIDSSIDLTRVNYKYWSHNSYVLLYMDEY